MARKQTASIDEYNKPFPARLRTTMAARQKTQQDLADVLGLSRQAVGQYMSGESKPSWETIAEIARALSVSTDYLLGLTVFETPDCSLRGVCEATGLSEAAAKSILGYDYYYMVGNDKTPLPSDIGLKPSEVLSRLLESVAFWRVIGTMSTYTTTMMQEQFELADQYRPTAGGLPSVPGYLKPNPAFEPIDAKSLDLHLGAAVVAFGEAAKEVLTIYAEERNK